MLREQKETVGLATGGDAMRARFQSGTEVRPPLPKLELAGMKGVQIPAA